jgi:hypothetical protein
MAGVTSKLARLLVGAGAIGVILALAGVHSPVRTALVLLFLAVAPTAAIAGLLRDFDPFARLILAVVSTVALLSIIGMILLSAGLWSPIGELLVVAAITVICLVAQRPAVRARVAAWARPRWQALLRHVPRVRTALTTQTKDAAAEAATAGTAAVGADTADATAGAGMAGATAGAAGNGHAAAGNGQAAPYPAEAVGNGQAAPHTAEAEGPTTSPAEAETVVLPSVNQAEPDTVVLPSVNQAEPDTVVLPSVNQAEPDTVELDGAELDRAALDEAATTAETEAGTGTGGPTEVTSPLPAIRD